MSKRRGPKRLSRKHFPIHDCPCPYCGKPTTRVGFGDDDDPPDPKTAIILCIKCAGVCMLTSESTLRKITDVELMEFLADTPKDVVADFYDRLATITQMNRRNNAGNN